MNIEKFTLRKKALAYTLFLTMLNAGRLGVRPLEIMVRAITMELLQTGQLQIIG
jgi:hypothetical protein